MLHTENCELPMKLEKTHKAGKAENVKAFREAHYSDITSKATSTNCHSTVCQRNTIRYFVTLNDNEGCLQSHPVMTHPWTRLRELLPRAVYSAFPLCSKTITKPFVRRVFRTLVWPFIKCTNTITTQWCEFDKGPGGHPKCTAHEGLAFIFSQRPLCSILNPEWQSRQEGTFQILKILHILNWNMCSSIQRKQNIHYFE